MRNTVFDDRDEVLVLSHEPCTPTAAPSSRLPLKFTIAIKPATVHAALAALDLSADDPSREARHRSAFAAAAQAIRDASSPVDAF